MKLRIIYKSGVTRLMLVPKEITVVALGLIITIDNDSVSKIEFI